MNYLVLIQLLGLISLAGCDTAERQVDPNGYVMFCPCMGRFGNQADQFIGSLLFAKSLDRTIILPDWVEYPPGSIRSVQVPFDRYYKPESIAQYHRVILMHDFMKHLAPTVWPKGKRVAFCYQARDGTKPKDCNARDGNPFDSFWATFDIQFDSSEFFQPLYYNAENEFAAKEWKRKYSAEKYPVLAFTGAPSPYPPQPAAWPLQKYIQFSDFITFKAQAFIKENIRRPYVAIHLRNGDDWKNACEHIRKINKGQHMFDSAQCLGQNFEYGQLRYEHCFPPSKTIVDQVAAAVKKYHAKTVFIATDSNDMKDKIRSTLRDKKIADRNTEIVIIRNPDPQDVHMDLAILSEADFFIGNCLSSFSAFVVRQRNAAENKPSRHFYLPRDEPRPAHDAGEL